MKATRKLVLELEDGEAYALYKVLGHIRTCDFTDVYKLTVLETDTIQRLINELPIEQEEE